MTEATAVPSVAETLDGLDLVVSTPDETVFGQLLGRDRVRVWFAPDYYRYSNDQRIEQKLAQLGRLMWVARMRVFWEAMSANLDTDVRGEPAPRTDEERARREARSAIVATGSSDDGLVEVSAQAMFSWSVRLRPGSIPGVAEETLTAACSQAAERLVADQYRQLRKLRAEQMLARASL